MVSDEKLIKQGIRYTDALFKELENRLRQGVINSDSLEAFLEKTKEYTTNNPLVTTGYDATLLKIILAETNNHKFTRPAQKELVRVTIENQVGELITNVGEDIKADVRDIVKSGYNEGLSQYEIADNISHRIKTIKNTRANVIARTEIARTATVSDYIINKERGANYFVVDCRSTRCEVCKEAYCKSSPIGGDVEYDIDDVAMLPPRHPNCRCVAVFGVEPNRKSKPKEDVEEGTEEVTTQTEKPKQEEQKPKPKSNLKFEELETPEQVAEYFGFEYSFGGFPQVDKEVLKGKDGKPYRAGKNENKTGKYHKFYDRENDCTLYFHQALTKPSSAKATKGKIFIDTSNKGTGVHNLKDVMKMYDDAPRVLKEANTSITFTNRTAKRLYGYNKIHDNVWDNNLDHQEVYVKQITHGRKQSAFIDIYKNALEDDLSMGHSMQRTLYHEMAHGLDNKLSSAWTQKGRFSDKRTDDGYGAVVKQQTNWSEDFRTKSRTPKEIADGLSSEYGKRHCDKTLSYSEDFADCVSMVTFKYIEDKTGASILPPEWSWSNKLPAYDYDEFVKKYPHKVKFIEEVLGIAN